MFNNSKKVIVGISGGVDSSICAWLLKNQGYQVEGLFMKNWEEDDTQTFCSSAQDLDDAQNICDMLGIYLHTVNFSTEYWDNVFMPFLDEYKVGRTPNPDILCNKEIKFKIFLKFAIEDLGADYIATGHYVRCLNIGKTSYLLCGIDNNKDQSYFLYTLNQKQLHYSLFPLGIFMKSSVRNIAKKLNLITANKKDSTGICFIGKRNFREFLMKYLPKNLGNIVTVYGKTIGCHQGLMYYTFGQRKGLNIGGISSGNGSPWYVVEKDLVNNLLIVAQDKNHPKIMSCGCIINNIHWINNIFLKQYLYCIVKIRYQHIGVKCKVQLLSNGYMVLFKNLIASVTPGQSAVFYLSKFCLGGGVIDSCF